MELYCALCLYMKEGEAEKAITILEGYAVCEDHMNHVQNSNFGAIISSMS